MILIVIITIFNNKSLYVILKMSIQIILKGKQFLNALLVVSVERIASHSLHKNIIFEC